jgi:hypothetical protein
METQNNIQFSFENLKQQPHLAKIHYEQEKYNKTRKNLAYKLKLKNMEKRPNLYGP